ncbi:MAG: hypothetical protein CVU56_24425 [Deltaproteobacteria bacterium HGW-Deltaproteobacteria-14]|jgi:hypothetical protein|nr:MAG: hypothetical protein CVU56_24425 [Deltaproteobacteria bacterium HGW-Deltaproteobacteria-14]
MTRTICRIALSTLLATTAGCASGDAGTSAPTKAEAAATSGKSDAGRDLCAAYGWYGDGECDTFCASPDPDCGPPVDALARWNGVCQLGADWLDLDDDLTLLSSDTLTPDSTLSGAQEQQLVVGLDVGSVADAFDSTDDGEILLYGLGPAGGAASVWLYRYYAGDTEVGFFVRPDGAEVLARIEDGALDAPCAASLTTDAAPVAAPPTWALECFFNDDGVDLLRVAIGPEREVGADAALTDMEKRQILAGMANADATTLAEAFEFTDDGAFFVRALTDPESGDAFTVYRYWAGDTQVGFVVPAEGVEVKATIEDGDLYDCSLSFQTP